MLYPNINGLKPTISEAFHDLNSYLYNIKHLNIDSSILTDECLVTLRSLIFAFNPQDGIEFINVAIFKIDDLLSRDNTKFKVTPSTFISLRNNNEDGFDLTKETIVEPTSFQEVQKNNLLKSIKDNLRSIKHELIVIKDELTIQVGGIEESLKFDPILLKKDTKINVITTLFKKLERDFVDTSKVNLGRVILAVFRTSEGNLLSQQTIDTNIKRDRSDSKKV